MVLEACKLPSWRTALFLIYLLYGTPGTFQTDSVCTHAQVHVGVPNTHRNGKWLGYRQWDSQKGTKPLQHNVQSTVRSGSKQWFSFRNRTKKPTAMFLCSVVPGSFSKFQRNYAKGLERRLMYSACDFWKEISTTLSASKKLIQNSPAFQDLQYREETLTTS